MRLSPAPEWITQEMEGRQFSKTTSGGRRGEKSSRERSDSPRHNLPGQPRDPAASLVGEQSNQQAPVSNRWKNTFDKLTEKTWPNFSLCWLSEIPRYPPVEKNGISLTDVCVMPAGLDNSLRCIHCVSLLTLRNSLSRPGNFYGGKK